MSMAIHTHRTLCVHCTIHGGRPETLALSPTERTANCLFFMMSWIVSVFVDVRAARGLEVHLTSGRRSHTDSVFGIKWTAGRVVSVPSHNRACTRVYCSCHDLFSSTKFVGPS